MQNKKFFKIQNRRYLGNKYKLLSFIYDTISANCKDIKSIADIFAGTGVFCSAFSDKKIITNDILYSNYICNYAWFGNKKINIPLLYDIIEKYNAKKCDKKNYMTDNFAETFFSFNVCSKIGYIRENIEKLFNEKYINDRERALLIMTLLYAMDKIANTCGHYDAYIRNAVLTDNLILDFPDIQNINNKKNKCYNMDANELVKKISVDLVYIDPPYNSRQYCDAYHLLENVARWNKPKVFGVAKKMDRSKLKSKYCTNEAKKSFTELIDNISAKYIVLSYNNTGNKANERSNAKINDKDILNILSNKGSVTIYEQNYKAFTTGKSHNHSNKERLFICKVKTRK